MVADTTTADAGGERLAFAPAEDEGPDAYRPGGEQFGRTGAATRPRPPRSLQSWLASMRDAITRDLAVESERGTGFLLIPVLFGAGAATNFALDHDPSMLLLGGAVLATTAGIFTLGQRAALRLLLTGVLIFILGMFAASLEIWRADTKMLGADISTRISGRVVSVEERAGGRARITIDVTGTDRPRLRYAPERVRVTARDIPPELVPGQGVTGVVRLLPPTGPVRPDSYDFSFESYFDGIGASGFFLSGPFAAEAEVPADSYRRLAARVERARYALAAHIRSRIGGPEGEIAAALVAGVRSGIPEEVNEALRRTGLAHFLAISGLHMALVAGTVVGGLRALFALFPGFASRHPVKKYAALSALIAITVYLVISGSAVAAQRSFIMFAVMLAAVLVDRAALTMRNLAIAGLIVLAIAPHEIMGPSFQMSFAATAALIGAYAWFSERRRAKAVDGSWREMPIWRRGLHVALLFFGGLAMTSLIAGTATGLYGAWHFNRVAPLGLVANLAAMPIVTVAVMPMAVIGTVLIPLGLDAPFFAVMGRALAAVVEIAGWLSERSPLDEVGLVPPAAVAILSVALAIATIATTWLRAAALPLVIIGGALIVMREVPEILVSEDGRLVAVRMSDGRLAVNRGRPSAFTVDNWSKALQGKGVVKPSDTKPGDAGEHPFACREGLCLARHRSGAGIAFAGTGAVAGLACERAVLIVIDDATAEGACAGAGPLLITKRDLARKGAAAISLNAGGKIATVSFAIDDGERPWHMQRRFSREARGMPPYQRNRQGTSREVPTVRVQDPASSPDGKLAAAQDQ